MPAVETPRVVEIAVQTADGGVINQRAFDFAFVNELVIQEIIPIKSSLEGGYTFTILGNFDFVVEKGVEALYWGADEIKDRITSVESDRIVGVVPPSDAPGRREVSLVVDRITYWNATVHFTYVHLPITTSCWPYSGQSSFETMLTIIGENFESETSCLFGAPPFGL